jgi:hypothetical protein
MPCSLVMHFLSFLPRRAHIFNRVACLTGGKSLEDLLVEGVLNRVIGICRMSARDRLFLEKECFNNYLMNFSEDLAHFTYYVFDVVDSLELGHVLPKDPDELEVLLVAVYKRVVDELKKIVKMFEPS